MSWDISFLPEAQKDLYSLDGSVILLIRKAIKKVSVNPLPDYEGGYGKPLGNHHGLNLTGFLKIKLKDSGLRIVYMLVRTETQMKIIVIGARADEEVYEIAYKRKVKYFPDSDHDPE